MMHTEETMAAASAQTILETASFVVSSPTASAFIVKASGREALDAAAEAPEVAALEARTDLFQRGDQGVEEHRAGLHAPVERLVGEVEHGRAVADEGLVIEPLEDFVGSHAAPSWWW